MPLRILLAMKPCIHITVNYMYVHNHHTGSYMYTQAFLKLAACINPSPPPLPQALCNITTPLNLSTWTACLASHPDQAYVKFILDGIANGFRIGFAYSTSICTPASTNHPSANEHPEVISTALLREVSKGRLIGPLCPQDYPYMQVSSLGAVPKKHSIDKWRLILDLSHPVGTSVNDGIDPALCSLTYMKVDHAVQHVLALGRGCQLAKIDIEAQWRIQDFRKGGSFICRADAEGSAQRRGGVLISPHEARKFIFTFIFQLSGWALVASSCFALQAPDVKGLQDPGPPCASVSCSNFAHTT